MCNSSHTGFNFSEFYRKVNIQITMFNKLRFIKDCPSKFLFRRLCMARMPGQYNLTVSTFCTENFLQDNFKFFSIEQFDKKTQSIPESQYDKHFKFLLTVMIPAQREDSLAACAKQNRCTNRTIILRHQQSNPKTN